MSEWIDLQLGEFAPFSYGKSLPERDRKPGDVPVLSSAGIIGTHGRPFVPTGGVVIGRKGTVGSVSLSKVPFWPIDTAFYVPDEPKKRDLRFTYYLLQTLGLGSMNSDSAVPGLNRDNAHALTVHVPRDVCDQQAIAYILGTLDDKIELNRRMNETLEAMARAIFQSWFVDFDPVRAKASGESANAICQRLGLTPELLALFPDSFEDSELGEIPRGWAVTTLRSMACKIGSGATPRGGSDVYLEEGTSLIRSQNVYDSEFVWDGLAHITDEAAQQLSSVEVKKGDVLINITGASILRTCVVDPQVLPARVNQHVAIIRAKADDASRYLHLHLLQADTKAYLMGLNAGASREAVTKGHLESVPIIDPGPLLLKRFNDTVISFYVQGEQLTHQARTLQGLRDALLPKLLSGEMSTQGRSLVAV